MEKRYSLEANEAQMNILIQALDLFSRIGMGQIESVADHPEITERVMQSTTHVDMTAPDAMALFDNARMQIFGYGRGASAGIHSDEISDVNRVAWDMMKVILHRLSWDRAGNPEARDFSTMIGVNFDDPRQSSHHHVPLASITPIEAT